MISFPNCKRLPSNSCVTKCPSFVCFQLAQWIQANSCESSYPLWAGMNSIKLRNICDWCHPVKNRQQNWMNWTKITFDWTTLNIYGKQSFSFVNDGPLNCKESMPSRFTRANAFFGMKRFPYINEMLIIIQLVPYEHYDGKSVLPLNKLNLQFLTLHDYLLRNFNLFRMESTCTFKNQ